MHLDVRHTRIGDRPVVVVAGVADLSTVPRLHSELVRVAHDHPGVEVVVDLEQVEALDDTALGVLLGAAGRCRETGGDLVVVTAHDRFTTRFARTGFDRAVQVRATVV